ncbi:MULTISPECIES: hypothetical protein [Terrabacteria group]
MPRQLDQLPADATSLARRVQDLERQVRELRAARRLSSAAVGTLRLYAGDGTVLAELGTDGGGGAGLWTRGGRQSARLSDGRLTFRPVEDGLVAVPASVDYDTAQSSVLTLASGAVEAGDRRALLALESGPGGTNPRASVQGVLTASNIVTGTATITPSAANAPTSLTVAGLNITGTNLRAYATAIDSSVGTNNLNNGVSGVGVTDITNASIKLWITRATVTPAVTVHWMVIAS